MLISLSESLGETEGKTRDALDANDYQNLSEIRCTLFVLHKYCHANKVLAEAQMAWSIQINAAFVSFPIFGITDKGSSVFLDSDNHLEHLTI